MVSSDTLLATQPSPCPASEPTTRLSTVDRRKFRVQPLQPLVFCFASLKQGLHGSMPPVAGVIDTRNILRRQHQIGYGLGMRDAVAYAKGSLHLFPANPVQRFVIKDAVHLRVALERQLQPVFHRQERF